MNVKRKEIRHPVDLGYLRDPEEYPFSRFCILMDFVFKPILLYLDMHFTNLSESLLFDLFHLA